LYDNPVAVEDFRRSIRETPVTPETLGPRVEQALKSTRVARPVTQAEVDKAASELQGAARALFQLLNARRVSQEPVFSVLILNPEEAGVNQTRLRALAARIQADENTAAAVYGLDRESAAALLGMSEEELAQGDFKRILFVGHDRGVPIASFEEAVKIAGAQIPTGKVLFNHFRREVRLAQNMPLAEIMGRVSVLVPSGEAGTKLAGLISGKQPSIVQLLSYDRTQITGQEASQALLDFETRILTVLKELDLAALIREIGEVAIEQVGQNQYRFTGTPAALNFILQVYRAQLRIAAAA
jgi:hypothetical protein